MNNHLHLSIEIFPLLSQENYLFVDDLLYSICFQSPSWAGTQRLHTIVPILRPSVPLRRFVGVMSSDSEDDENPLPLWMDDYSLAPYQGSKPETVAEVLRLADLTPSDVLYDLGCGDCRIPIAAAENYGCKAVGIEMYVFDKAEKRLKAEIAKQRQSAPNRISELVTIRSEDALTCDMTDCTVCVLFLLPSGLELMQKRMHQLLDQGVRIVTIYWGLKTRKPIKESKVDSTSLYYYTKDSEKI